MGTVYGSVSGNERFDDSLHFHAAGTFDEQQITGLKKLLNESTRFLGRRKKFRMRAVEAGGDGSFDNFRSIARDADNPIDLAGVCGGSTCFAVKFTARGTEFAHFSGGKNAALKTGRRSEQRGHRVQRRGA